MSARAFFAELSRQCYCPLTCDPADLFDKVPQIDLQIFHKTWWEAVAEIEKKTGLTIKDSHPDTFIQGAPPSRSGL